MFILKIEYDGECQKSGSPIRKGGTMCAGDTAEEANDKVKQIKDFLGAEHLNKYNYTFEAIKD